MANNRIDGVQLGRDKGDFQQQRVFTFLCRAAYFQSNTQLNICLFAIILANRIYTIEAYNLQIACLCGKGDTRAQLGHRHKMCAIIGLGLKCRTCPKRS